jgi:D-3-phosphoglycerate dehydrogenase
VEPVSEEVISAATELRAVSRNGVGVDNFPLLQLQERGIRVHTADGANAAGVAELTIGLMFSALRHILLTDAGIKAGGWPRIRGREICGRTVGIIGCGHIGERVAKLVTAIGGKVAAHDPLRRDIGISADCFHWADIPDILAKRTSLRCIARHQPTVGL